MNHQHATTDKAQYTSELNNTATQFGLIKAEWCRNSTVSSQKQAYVSCFQLITKTLYLSYYILRTFINNLHKKLSLVTACIDIKSKCKDGALQGSAERPQTDETII